MPLFKLRLALSSVLLMATVMGIALLPAQDGCWPGVHEQTSLFVPSPFGGE